MAPTFWKIPGPSSIILNPIISNLSNSPPAGNGYDLREDRRKFPVVELLGQLGI